MNILLNEEDPDELIERLIKRPVIATIKAVIEKWHSYDGCDVNYNDYTDVDTNSHPYKILKACAEIKGCRVEPIIKYLVEGAC